MTKDWKYVGTTLGFSKRAMLQLPAMLNGTKIYLDRRTGIYWKEDLCNGPSSWSYWKPTPLKARKAPSCARCGTCAIMGHTP